MRVTFSPSPSDGPLNKNATSVTITITTVLGGGVGGIIKVPGRPPIEVPSSSLLPGRTRVVIPLPPGGLPAGSELRLAANGADGSFGVAVYKFT